jgi:hypothetical protein
MVAQLQQEEVPLTQQEMCSLIDAVTPARVRARAAELFLETEPAIITMSTGSQSPISPEDVHAVLQRLRR